MSSLLEIMACRARIQSWYMTVTSPSRLARTACIPVMTMMTRRATSTSTMAASASMPQVTASKPDQYCRSMVASLTSTVLQDLKLLTYR